MAPYFGRMSNSENYYVLWVAPETAAQLSDPALRERANVDDPVVEVRTRRLGNWMSAVIPSGSRDEWGDTTRDLLNVWPEHLGPDGKVYFIEGAPDPADSGE